MRNIKKDLRLLLLWNLGVVVFFCGLIANTAYHL
jgi:hypothetical protein